MFVGREAELQELIECAYKALAGQGGVVFVTGEAGAGKTELVKEFLRRLQAEQPQILAATGRCTVESASYLPFRSLLEQLLSGQTQPPATDAATPPPAEAIAEIICQVGPELLGVFGISVKTLQSAAGEHTRRLQQQCEELQVRWDLLSKKLAALEEEKILETQADEKFQLDHNIHKIKAEREEITRELEQLETELASTGCARLQDQKEFVIPKELDQTQVFGWYTKVLQNIATRRPLVLFLDDLHWADASSLNLLLHLGREIEQNRLLVIGTYRPHEVTPNALLFQVKDKLRRHGAKTVSLDVSAEQPSDQAKITSFVHAYLLAQYQTNFSDQFEHLLVTRTEGNALFLTEILKNMEEKGQIEPVGAGVTPALDPVRADAAPAIDPKRAGVTPAPTGWRLTTAIDRLADLPEKVEAVISERVNRLEKLLREILNYASVEGDEFIAQVIAKVRHIEEDALLDDLNDKLLKIHQLIYEQGGKSLPNGSRIYEFAFRHNLIREYVYANLPASKRERIHAQVGECLERLYAPNPDEIMAQLAVHFFQGHVQDKAVYYCLKAAQNANGRYGAAEAVHFARMGLEALEERAKTIFQEEYAEAKIRLLMELARAEEFGGNPQEEKDHIQAGIMCLENNLALLNSLEEKLRAEIYFQLGKLQNRQIITRPKAKEYLENALKIYEQCGDQKNVAEILYLLTDVYPSILTSLEEVPPDEKGFEATQKSLAIAEQIQDRGLQARCLIKLGDQYPRLKRGFSYITECTLRALELSQVSDKLDKYAEIKALTQLGNIFGGYAKFRTGIQHYEQALKLAKQIGSIDLESEILNVLGHHYAHYIDCQGESLSKFEESLSIRKRVGYSPSSPYSDLGWTYTRLGKWNQAETVLRKAGMVTTERGEAYQRYRIARLYTVSEKYQQAEEEYIYILKIRGKYRASQGLLECSRIAQNYAFLNKRVECQEFIKICQNLLEKDTSPRLKMEALYELAETYRLLEELITAKSACQQSIDWYLTNAEDPEKLYCVAEARLIMGKILMDMGAYQDALDYLAKAQTAFAICGHYARGETLLYLGKAYQGLGGAVFRRQAQAYVTQAVAEFQRLELHHKEREAGELLKTLT